MHVNSLVLAGLLAASATALAAERASMRSAWYLGAGLGASWASDQQQQGWNLDNFCYPSDACFNETPVPAVPGYRWRYDIALDGSAEFELSFGRYFGRTRLELALARRRNGIDQSFTGIHYRDGTEVRPRPGGAVVSGARASIDHQRLRSVSLDIYRDFPVAWNRVSPYVGAGVGRASVEIAGLHFSTDYRDVSGPNATHEPPLAFFNAVQDADLDDTAILLRLHAGADYALSSRTSVGLRLTWSAADDVEHVGAYDAHPMHPLDPGFTNTNEFSGARSLTLMLAFRRRLGD